MRLAVISWQMSILRFNVLSIDYVRVTNCFYDYDYDDPLCPLCKEEEDTSLHLLDNSTVVPSRRNDVNSLEDIS